MQVLESNSHLTYADGGAGAIYGVWPPLVNPARPMGEWNVYDIFFEAPQFDGGKVVKPAYMTVLFNGVLVQNHKDYLGTTIWRQVGKYTAAPGRRAAEPAGPLAARALPEYLDPQTRLRNRTATVK